MIVEGRFTVVSVGSREYNGTTYYDCNIEADNRVLRVNTDKACYDYMANNKYKPCIGTFDLGVSRNGLYIKLKEVKPCEK